MTSSKMSVLLFDIALENLLEDVFRTHSRSHRDPRRVGLVGPGWFAELKERLGDIIDRHVFKMLNRLAKNVSVALKNFSEILKHLHHLNSIVVAVMSAFDSLHLLLKSHLQHHDLKIRTKMAPGKTVKEDEMVNKMFFT